MPDICAPSLQEESLPAESTLTTETQERASLQGLLVEDFKKEINNSHKEIQENSAKQVEALKEETQNPLKNYRKTNQTGDGIEQNLPRSKNGSRNNKENPKEDNSGDRNPRKEMRNHRYKHQQQNTRDGRENLRCRRYHRKH